MLTSFDSSSCPFAINQNDSTTENSLQTAAVLLHSSVVVGKLLDCGLCSDTHPYVHGLSEILGGTLHFIPLITYILLYHRKHEVIRRVVFLIWSIVLRGKRCLKKACRVCEYIQSQNFSGLSDCSSQYATQHKMHFSLMLISTC